MPVGRAPGVHPRRHRGRGDSTPVGGAGRTRRRRHRRGDAGGAIRHRRWPALSHVLTDAQRYFAAGREPIRTTRPSGMSRCGISRWPGCCSGPDGARGSAAAGCLRSTARRVPGSMISMRVYRRVCRRAGSPCRPAGDAGSGHAKKSRRAGATRSGLPHWSRFWVALWLVPGRRTRRLSGIARARASTAARR